MIKYKWNVRLQGIVYTYLSLKQRIDCSEFFDLAKLGEGNIAVLY